MSGAFDVKPVTVSIGALSNATYPLFPAPTDPHGGGLTVVEAYAYTGGTSSASLELIKGTINAGGTFTANGTLGTIGGTASQWAAGARREFTIADGFVDAGEQVAVKETNVQALHATSVVQCLVTMGR